MRVLIDATGYLYKYTHSDFKSSVIHLLSKTFEESNGTSFDQFFGIFDQLSLCKTIKEIEYLLKEFFINKEKSVE